jgi:phosphoribosylformylglycinamidine synthase
VLLGKTPKMTRDVQTRKAAGKALDRQTSPLPTR